MKAWLLLWLAAQVSCSVPRSTLDATSLAESSCVTGSSVLGVGFGRLITIEATPVVEHPAKGALDRILRVWRVNGDRAPDGLAIRWTYGGWDAEKPEAAGKDGFLVEAGQVYRLRGYEAGAWEGMPHDVHAILGDEFGPRQGTSFHFRSVFRIIDGELVAHGSR